MTKRVAWLRDVAFGVAMTLVSGLALPAETSTEGPQLVDHAAEFAVFKQQDDLILVRVGERVPQTSARLVQVDPSGVQIEYFSSADSTAGIVVLTRGAFASVAWPKPEVPADPLPLITVMESPTAAHSQAVKPEVTPQQAPVGGKDQR